MPTYVFKNKGKDVQPMVVDLEEHQLDAFAAQWADGGWSLDKKADPAEVAVATNQGAAAQTGALKEH